MKIKTLIGLAICTFALLLPSHAEERVVLEGAYSVTLTDGWADSAEQNEDALIFVEKGAMAFDLSGNVYESAEEIDLATIVKESAEAVPTNLEGAKVGPIRDGDVNGMPAKFFTYKFTVEHEGTTYHMTTRMLFVKTGNYMFYMTGIAPSDTSKKDIQDLMKVMKSFKKK